jgi:hypothetical protein
MAELGSSSSRLDRPRRDSRLPSARLDLSDATEIAGWSEESRRRRVGEEGSVRRASSSAPRYRGGGSSPAAPPPNWTRGELQVRDVLPRAEKRVLGTVETAAVGSRGVRVARGRTCEGGIQSLIALGHAEERGTHMFLDHRRPFPGHAAGWSRRSPNGYSPSSCESQSLSRSPVKAGIGVPADAALPSFVQAACGGRTRRRHLERLGRAGLRLARRRQVRASVGNAPRKPPGARSLPPSRDALPT